MIRVIAFTAIILWMFRSIHSLRIQRTTLCTFISTTITTTSIYTTTSFDSLLQQKGADLCIPDFTRSIS